MIDAAIPPSPSGDPDADRKKLLLNWALGALRTLGFEQAVAQAATAAELHTITLESQEAGVALAIRDALFPASGKRDGIFVGLREGGLKSILRNRLDDMKRDREKALANAPPPPDPRAAQPHPFADPKFTPVDLVYEASEIYLYMLEPVRVIYSCWVPYTHVYYQFKIAPRLAFTSEFPSSGKTTAVDVSRPMVLRPNLEALGTGAAVRAFLNEGPGTVLLDELDMVDEDTRRELLRVWNLGHKFGARHSMMVKGQRVLQNLYAPVAGAGLGSFLGASQRSRTYCLEMEKYTAATRPPKDFYAQREYQDLDAVHSYLRYWSSEVKLDLNPPIPEDLLGRHADNLRGLLSVAYTCSDEWGQRLCEAIRELYVRERAERPEILIIRHGLVILERLGAEQIEYKEFNRR
jgi:hypothetical protein